jgi:hypothetical protein
MLTERRADLVHLHWLGDGTLSIEEIGRLLMPLVWTLHDQWAFCGAEHYTSPPVPGETASSDERFSVGYSPASAPPMKSGPTTTAALGCASAAPGAGPSTFCAPATGWLIAPVAAP